MAAVTLPERVEERNGRRDCLQRWSMCLGGNRVLIKEHRSGTKHVAGDKPEARTDQPPLWGAVRIPGDVRWRRLHSVQQTSFYAAWRLLHGEF